MDTDLLTTTAQSLVAGDKGLLAMDESNPTCHKRFVALGIPQTVEFRRAYREMIVTAPGSASRSRGRSCTTRQSASRQKRAFS